MRFTSMTARQYLEYVLKMAGGLILVYFRAATQMDEMCVDTNKVAKLNEMMSSLGI